MAAAGTPWSSVAIPAALSAIARISDAPSAPGIGTGPRTALLSSAVMRRLMARFLRLLLLRLGDAVRKHLPPWLVHGGAVGEVGTVEPFRRVRVRFNGHRDSILHQAYRRQGNWPGWRYVR